MRRKQRFVVLLFGVLVAGQNIAQVQVDPSGNYRLNPTAPGPRNFTIGSTYATGVESALNVRGDLLGTGYNTGEVFRTYTNSDTYSRLLCNNSAYFIIYKQV